METRATSRTSVLALRWIVRIVGSLFAAFWFYFLIGEYLEGRTRPQNPPIAIGAVVELTIVSLSLVGLLVAWKWELAGGAVALAAFVLANVINPGFLVLWPVAIAAVLFLTCWWFGRQHTPSVRSENSK